MTVRWFFGFWIWLGWCAPALGVEIFLNGIQVTGAKEQVIENAKVILDKRGDVHIEASSYKVQENQLPTREAAAAQVPRPAVAQSLTRNYYLVNEVIRAGKVGVRLTIQVNDRQVGTLTDENLQLALELNPYLQPGSNRVSLLATPVLGALPAPGQWTVVIGEGKNRGAELTITKVLSEFKVIGGQGGNKEHTFTLTAQ